MKEIDKVLLNDKDGVSPIKWIGFKCRECGGNLIVLHHDITYTKVSDEGSPIRSMTDSVADMTICEKCGWNSPVDFDIVSMSYHLRGNIQDVINTVNPIDFPRMYSQSNFVKKD